MDQLYNKYLSCGGRLTTDSRAIVGGEMFLALKGENFDGNEYALKALEQGASYVVVNRGTAAAGHPQAIEVDDTFETLRALARHHRRQLRIPVVGLTGTNGKTTTKELIRTALAAGKKVCATEGNLNNDIGVPLSILKIRQDDEIAVIEMGANHPDDIGHLVDILEPDAGLITNVGKAHLLGFGSFDGVKKAKGQLYDYLSAHNGLVFINEDDADLMGMASARPGLSLVPYGFGRYSAGILPQTPDEPFLRVKVGERVIGTSLVGAYNATNVLAALCVAEHFGVDVEDAAAAIEAYVPKNNRSQMVRTESNVLVVDAYNANPSSMTAAIENFASIVADKKLALLGDMRELGTDSLKEHSTIVDLLQARGLDAMLVGDQFSAVSSGKFLTFADSDQLKAYLEMNKPAGCTILVKGSRGIQMEKVLPVL